MPLSWCFSLTIRLLFGFSDECVQSFDPHEGFTIHTSRAYDPGEQLCINYGHHANIRLLRNYGFVMPSNPHDVVDLPVPSHLQRLSTDDPAFAQKVELVEAMKIRGVVRSSSPPFLFKKTLRLDHHGELSSDSNLWLQLQTASSEELRLLVEQAFAREGSRHDDAVVQFPTSVACKLNDEISAIVDQRIRQHSTTLEVWEAFAVALTRGVLTSLRCSWLGVRRLTRHFLPRMRTKWPRGCDPACTFGRAKSAYSRRQSSDTLRFRLKVTNLSCANV